MIVGGICPTQMNKNSVLCLARKARLQMAICLAGIIEQHIKSLYFGISELQARESWEFGFTTSKIISKVI
jgi:hypothetical protein